jgi:hypothetical protein
MHFLFHHRSRRPSDLGAPGGTNRRATASQPLRPILLTFDLIGLLLLTWAVVQFA